jgi:hypothetical protein
MLIYQGFDELHRYGAKTKVTCSKLVQKARERCAFWRKNMTNGYLPGFRHKSGHFFNRVAHTQSLL